MPVHTDRPLLKELFRLALPIMAGNFLHSLFNLVDTIFLGRVGKEALSAPAIAMPVIFFFIVFGMGISVAGTTLIAQSKGKNDNEKADFYLGQMTVFIILASLVISILGFSLTPAFLKLIRVPDDSYQYTFNYMRIIFLGVPFMYMSFVFQGALRGVGDSMTPLMIQAVAIVLNIVLDPLLIFGIGFFPRMEVSGAALATIVSRLAASIVAVVLLARGSKGIRLILKNLWPDRRALKLFVDIGLPASLGQAVSALGFTALQGIVNGFGTSVVAAFGIGNRIINMFNMPGMGLSQATAVLAAQNLGRKDREGAKKVVRLAMLSIFIFITVGMVYTTFWGKHLIRLFIDDPEVIAVGSRMFLIFGPSVICFALFTIINGAFQGGGDTKPVMVMNMIRLWGLRLPLAWLLAHALSLGAAGIWWAMFISNVGVAVIGFLLYRTDRWMYKLNPDDI